MLLGLDLAVVEFVVAAELVVVARGLVVVVARGLVVVVGEETVAQVDVEGLVVIWELVVELELAVDC